jgi:hypothetical protein
MRWLAGLILLASLGLVLWAGVPAGRLEQSLVFSEQYLAQVGFIEQERAVLVAHHPGRFTLSWPKVMRIGEASRITLAVEIEPSASTEISGTPDLALEAQVDLPGVEHDPAGRVRTLLGQGGTTHFSWQVDPTQAGYYQGTAWLYPVFLAADGTQLPGSSSLAISAQGMVMRVVSLAGLSTTQCLALGVCGGAAGLLLMVFWHPSSAFLFRVIGGIRRMFSRRTTRKL